MKTYGWFRCASPDRIVREATGQRLTIVPAGVPDSFDVAYADGEFDCSLRLEIVRLPYKLPAHTLAYPAFFADPAHYGRWRRLDEFAVDALLCWQMTAGTATGAGLLTVGGWRGGTWQAELRCRTFGALSADVAQGHPRWPLAHPVVLPLDMPLPPPWRNVIGSGGIPRLEREDGGATISFREIEPATWRDNEPETHLHYTYADSDVSFTFQSAPRWGLSLGIVRDFECRESPPPRDLWPVDMLGNVHPWNEPPRVLALGYPAWLRMKTVLHDAWPAWGRDLKRVTVPRGVQVPPGHGRAGYVGNYGPSMSHGYTAGVMNGTWTLAYV
jgi:hypothetical protein